MSFQPNTIADYARGIRLKAADCKLAKSINKLVEAEEYRRACYWPVHRARHEENKHISEDKLKTIAKICEKYDEAKLQIFSAKIDLIIAYMDEAFAFEFDYDVRDIITDCTNLVHLFKEVKQTSLIGRGLKQSLAELVSRIKQRIFTIQCNIVKEHPGNTKSVQLQQDKVFFTDPQFHNLKRHQLFAEIMEVYLCLNDCSVEDLYDYKIKATKFLDMCGGSLYGPLHGFAKSLNESVEKKLDAIEESKHNAPEAYEESDENFAIYLQKQFDDEQKKIEADKKLAEKLHNQWTNNDLKLQEEQDEIILKYGLP